MADTDNRSALNTAGRTLGGGLLGSVAGFVGAGLPGQMLLDKMRWATSGFGYGDSMPDKRYHPILNAVYKTLSPRYASEAFKQRGAAYQEGANIGKQLVEPAMSHKALHMAPNPKHNIDYFKWIRSGLGSKMPDTYTDYFSQRATPKSTSTAVVPWDKVNRINPREYGRAGVSLNVDRLKSLRREAVLNRLTRGANIATVLGTLAAGAGGIYLANQ